MSVLFCVTTLFLIFLILSYFSSLLLFHFLSVPSHWFILWPLLFLLHIRITLCDIPTHFLKQQLKSTVLSTPLTFFCQVFCAILQNSILVSRLFSNPFISLPRLHPFIILRRTSLKILFDSITTQCLLVCFFLVGCLGFFLFVWIIFPYASWEHHVLFICVDMALDMSLVT